MFRALVVIAVAWTVAVAGATAKPKARFDVSTATPRVGAFVKFTAKRERCRKCRFRWHVVTRSKHRVLRKLGSGRALRTRFGRRGPKLVRLTAITRDGRRFRAYKRLRVRARSGSGVPNPGPPPPVGRPACAAGATQVTSASQLRAVVRGGANACVVAPVGHVSLTNFGGPRHIGTTGAGAIGAIQLNGVSRLTLQARFRSITVRRSSSITITQSIVGGTSNARVDDQLIFLPDGADDVSIRDSDIGWTTADNSGNTGYGLRVYEDADRLRVERNRFHHIAADGIQLGMHGANAVIDRNEFAYIAPPRDSNEHADDIQVVTNGPNLRITNNYLHHNGVFDAGGPRTGGSGPYIHAGNANPIVFENNLVRDEMNFMQVGNLGTGGCNRSNLRFRRNTFFRNGLLWPGGGTPDLHWRLCGGSNNVYERNVVNNRFGNEYGFAASGTAVNANLHGSGYAIDGAGNCTSAACNPRGAEPIGFRKPSGVHW
jgi:hypothetical protein